MIGMLMETSFLEVFLFDSIFLSFAIFLKLKFSPILRFELNTGPERPRLNDLSSRLLTAFNNMGCPEEATSSSMYVIKQMLVAY